MSPRIVTVTVNPALDLATTVAKLEPEEKLRAHGSRVDPGGGGVNVSRVVHRLGGDTLAIVALGGASGRAYRELIRDEGVPIEVVEIEGPTRQNFAVREEASGHQYRVVLEGPTLSPDEWQAVLARVRTTTKEDDWLVVSGSMPPGAPDDAVAQLVDVAHLVMAHPVVDSSRAELAAALPASPELVKPSRRELEELVGRQLPDDDSLTRAARAIIAEHGVGVVAVTLGADGALLVTAGEVERQPAVAVEAVSTIGAGDSFLAGLVLRLAQGRPLAEALRTALAAGAATAAAEGTELADREEVARFEQLQFDSDR